MLARTADLLDLAAAFTSGSFAGGPSFIVVRGSMLEVHRGPLHARIPLCVWARDRVIGWAFWEALPDARHAPETLDVERVLRIVPAHREAVQTRAVIEVRSERMRAQRRAYVEVLHGYGDRDAVAPRRLDLPLDGGYRGQLMQFTRLDLAWAPRSAPPSGGESLKMFASGLLVLRSPSPDDRRGVLPRKVASLFNTASTPSVIMIPDAWVAEPIRVVEHRDGLALIGDRWWASFGYSFEPLRES